MLYIKTAELSEQVWNYDHMQTSDYLETLKQVGFSSQTAHYNYYIYSVLPL